MSRPEALERVEPSLDAVDRAMMARVIACARRSGAAGEYPYAALVCRDGDIVVEAENRVKRDGDVTRHAEVVAISAAQKALASVSLDDCTLYANAEPCVFCSYAIRESRIGRVVFALKSPHMGGVSRWNVLNDENLSHKMPEVFAPPPEIVSGLMAKEAIAALHDWNPLAGHLIEKRGLLVGEAAPAVLAHRRNGFGSRLMRFFRAALFDRFGRR